MPVVLLFIVLILFFWLLSRSLNPGKGVDFSAPVVPKKMKITPIESESIRVKRSETIKVRPELTELIRIKPSNVFVVKASKISATRVAPASTVAVKPPRRGAWDERGWTRSLNGRNEIYVGFFAVGTERFQGRIEIRQRSNRVSMYIRNPPREIKQHRHGPCFQLVKDGWFHLHWSRPARNVDDAILYMERILDESLRNRSRR